MGLVKISFVNDFPYPCGCSASYSDGGGEYSNVIDIFLCEEHEAVRHPEDDAIARGYTCGSDGQWKEGKNGG